MEFGLGVWAVRFRVGASAFGFELRSLGFGLSPSAWFSIDEVSEEGRLGMESGRRALSSALPNLSHIMYLLIIFRNSTPTQNRKAVVC